MAKEKVCPRDEIADPLGMAVLPIDIYGFDEGLVSFRTLCGVKSSLVRFAPNRAIVSGPLCQENRASRPPVVGHGLTFEYDCSN